MTTPATWRVEIAPECASGTQLQSAAWQNISSYVKSLRITRGRATSAEDVQPATVEIVLDNAASGTGAPPWRPIHPLSAFGPSMVRGCGIRVRVTPQGGSAQTVFVGWADRWEPDDSDQDRPTVTLRGSDVLAGLARITLRSMSGECVSGLALSDRPDAVDFWPLTEESGATKLANFGASAGAVGTGRTQYSGRVVEPLGMAAGSLELSTPEGLLTDGAATFTRGDGGTPSPVISCRLRSGMDVTQQYVSRISMWTKLDVDPAGFDAAWTLWTADGTRLLQCGPELSGGTIRWRLKDDGGTTLLEYDTGGSSDGAWRWVSLILADDSVTGRLLLLFAIRDRVTPDRITTYTTPAGMLTFPRTAGYLMLGGSMSPTGKGKQSNTFQGTLSEPYVAYGEQTNLLELVGVNPSKLAVPGLVVQWHELAEPMMWTGSDVDNSPGAPLGYNSSETPAMPVQTSGMSLLEAWALLGRTVGGGVISHPSGIRQLVHTGGARPVAVSLTVDASMDLQLDGAGLPWELQERPTRQTVDSPEGSVTVVGDAAAESAGLRVEGDQVQVAATQDVATAEAYWRLAGGAAARIPSVAVDLSTSANNLWAAALGLLPGSRVRLSGLPTSIYGLSYLDFYVPGYEWAYDSGDQSAVLTLDLEPADDPPEARLDDDTYGRVAMSESSTVTGGTCVGSTSTGTVIVTTSTPLTTAGTEYPLDLLWGSERITIGSAPAGGTSPQTLTVTARGVAPSIAYSHSAGDSVQLWQAATVGR